MPANMTLNPIAKTGDACATLHGQVKSEHQILKEMVLMDDHMTTILTTSNEFQSIPNTFEKSTGVWPPTALANPLALRVGFQPDHQNKVDRMRCLIKLRQCWSLLLVGPLSNGLFNVQH